MTRLVIPLLAAAIVAMPAPAADQRMDALLAQGTSAYEYENYHEALEHFTAAMVYASSRGESVLYPASYLCAVWHFGRGVEASPPRARAACSLAKGDMQRFQLDLFRQVLEKEGNEPGSGDHGRIAADAAEALDWYLDDSR